MTVPIKAPSGGADIIETRGPKGEPGDPKELLENLSVGEVPQKAPDGSIQGVSVVSAALSTGTVIYSGGAYAARPTGYANVHWYGPTEPPAWVDGDVWTAT